jgi:phage terminase large subunit GpA-like protein
MQNLNNIANKLLDSHDYKLTSVLPAEWAEKNRVMTSEVSAYPGKYHYNITPYLTEIVNCLNPEHPAQIIAVMKGAQIGFSTGVIENGIGWIIDQKPAPTILISGNKELSKEIIEKRVDQMIDSCGLRHKIRPNSLRNTNKRTGDTSDSKEFSGGYLIADGANNVNKLRQRSLMYGFIDDFEAVKHTDKKAGSITLLIEQRFASYASRMKLFYISTPEIKQTSNIEPVFNQGDCRYYHVPCPCCGAYIVLHWKINSKINEGQKAGITFKIDDKGKLIPESVGYVCQECGEFFQEKNKYEMMLQGKWIPTKEPLKIGYYSYHLSALYAPTGMYNWTHYAGMFLNCYPYGLNDKPDVAQLKTFLNVCLGQTFEEKGRKIKAMQIAHNTREYKVGEVPIVLSEKDGNGKIVMITCSCDLNGMTDDARIDYEIVAWSETGSSYSVDAGSLGTFQRGLSKENRQLYSYKLNEANSVWKLFEQIIIKKYKTDNNSEMPIFAVGVDTGAFTLDAYTFVDKCFNYSNPLMICGLKGDVEKLRRIGSDTSTFKKSKEKNNLYILEVNQIKDELADKIDLRWNESSNIPQPVGFMNFPEPENGKYTVRGYFSQYEGESKTETLNSDGSVLGHKWQKKNNDSPNHFWDCRVYNIALKNIFMSEYCKLSNIKYPDWAAYCELIKKTL